MVKLILLIDIGNTNIVLGISKDNQIINTFRYVTNSLLTEDDYYQKISSSLNKYFKDDFVDGAIISSVVPQLDHVFNQMIEKYFKVKAMNVGPGLKSCLQIKIENPKQLGADLLCDAVGAYIKYGGPTIIIDMGTATKLLVVTKNKEFLGGAICAGIKGSMDSLVTTTSKLSRTSLEVPKKVINGDTSQCIQSGILYGHIAMVEGLVNKAKAEIGDSSTKVIVTGGYSNVIKAYLDSSYIYDANLLLDGMLFIYNKNK